MEQVNSFLQFILDACPVLEEFDLERGRSSPVNVADGSCMNLSFIYHCYIKEIQLVIKYCHYYTLNDGAKKYIRYNSEDSYAKYNPSSSLSSGGGDTEEASSTTATPFHVNLSYKHEAGIRLDLSDSPSSSDDLMFF